MYRPVKLLIVLGVGTPLLASCSLPKNHVGRETIVIEKDSPRHFEGVTPSRDPDTRPVIVAFGDSLTAGYGVAVSENYPSKLQAKLDDRGYSYRVVNAGVSGDTTAQGLNRIQLALNLNPKIAIVELGPNDGLRGVLLEATRQNLQETVERFQERGVKVILAGMTLPPNWGPAYISEFENMYKDLSNEYNTGLIPFFLEGVATIPDLNISDEIHPNGAGYDIVIENVWRALEPLLRKTNRGQQRGWDFSS